MPVYQGAVSITTVKSVLNCSFKYDFSNFKSDFSDLKSNKMCEIFQEIMCLNESISRNMTKLTENY